MPEALAPGSVTAVQLRSIRRLRGVPATAGTGGVVWSSTIVSLMAAVLRLPLQSVKRPQICLVPSPAGTDQPLYRAPKAPAGLGCQGPVGPVLEYCIVAMPEAPAPFGRSATELLMARLVWLV
jgi:hypothetical protein